MEDRKYFYSFIDLEKMYRDYIGLVRANVIPKTEKQNL